MFRQYMIAIMRGFGASPEGNEKQNGSFIFEVVLTAFFLFFIASCNDNPYPEEGIRSEIEPLQASRIGVYSIIPEAIHMTFPEGKLSEYQIDFIVPDGRPRVTFEGLPEGAFYDESSGKLVWHPDFQAANIEDPSAQSFGYNVLVTLGSTSDLITESRRQLSMVAVNVPRKFLLKEMSPPALTTAVAEGGFISIRFEVDNEDFPQGPFSVQALGLPVGAEILEGEDKKSFQINYRPDHTVVNFASGDKSINCLGRQNCYKSFKPELIVMAPDGRALKEKTTIIRVTDKRLPFLYGIGSNIELEAPRGGTFYFSAYDQNLETHPTITLVRKPHFGEIQVTPVKSEGNHYGSTLQVTWNNIPKERAGAKYVFLMKVCIRSSLHQQAMCESKNVNVHILEHKLQTPSVIRTEWSSNEIKFLPFGSRNLFPISFEVGEKTVTNVKVVPKEMEEMVTPFVKSRKLRVHGKKPGLHQFSLEATASNGDMSTESFVFEVFPESRSMTVYLGDSFQHPSQLYYRSLAGSDYYSPFIEYNNEKELLYRDRLIIAGDILSALSQTPSDSPTHGFIQNIIKEKKNFKRIFIAAPNLSDLTRDLKQSLEDLGVLLEPRLENVVGWNVIPLDTLQKEKPINPIPLKGAFTPDSLHPTPLKLTLLNEACKGLMVLQKGREQYYASVECSLGDDRKLIVSGLEWGDLQFDSEDEGLAKKWYETLMKIY